MEISRKYSHYFLECIFDSRNSFYKKAKVEVIKERKRKEYILFSYNTLVAKKIETSKNIYYFCFGYYSQTTTRHQKEFFKQDGLSDKEIKELLKKGKLAIKKEDLPF